MSSPSFVDFLLAVAEVRDYELLRRVGLTVLATSWVGVVIAGWLAVSLHLARDAAPRFRYYLGFAALAMLLTTPFWTYARFTIVGSADTPRSFALGDAYHRRYDEFFAPPANIESLIPTYQWRETSVGQKFNIDGVGSYADLEGGNSVEGWVPDVAHRDTTWLRIRYGEDFELVADLELDGRPDFRYDGETVELTGDYEVVVDEGDSRRAQWLVSKRGEKPREAPRLFFYRDGGTFLILMDTDGDGRGNLGRSNSTSPR